jgi:hypothetical protein
MISPVNCPGDDADSDNEEASAAETPLTIVISDINIQANAIMTRLVVGDEEEGSRNRRIDMVVIGVQ